MTEYQVNLEGLEGESKVTIIEAASESEVHDIIRRTQLCKVTFNVPGQGEISQFVFANSDSDANEALRVIGIAEEELERGEIEVVDSMSYTVGEVSELEYTNLN